MIRQHYQPLRHISAEATASISVSDPSTPAKLSLDSPALDAMTDLTCFLSAPKGASCPAAMDLSRWLLNPGNGESALSFRQVCTF